MAGIGDFLKKQKEGATFVISAQMLRMKPLEFDALAQAWFDDVKQRATLSRLGVETASNSFHPSM